MNVQAEFVAEDILKNGASCDTSSSARYVDGWLDTGKEPKNCVPSAISPPFSNRRNCPWSVCESNQFQWPSSSVNSGTNLEIVSPWRTTGSLLFALISYERITPGRKGCLNQLSDWLSRRG